MGAVEGAHGAVGVLDAPQGAVHLEGGGEPERGRLVSRGIARSLFARGFGIDVGPGIDRLSVGIRGDLFLRGAFDRLLKPGRLQRRRPPR